MNKEDIYITSFLKKSWKPNWFLHPPASEALLEMVIVEPRIHPNLPDILANVSHMLPYAALTIVHSKNNEAYLQEIIPKNTNIRLWNLLPDNLSLAEYTRVLLSPSFWKGLTSDKILIFQTDTGVRKNNILDFIHVDYIGAPWDVSWGEEGEKSCYVGNGGFSLRTRTAMIDLCEKEHAKIFNGPEDVYFVREMSKHNEYQIASSSLAKEFSVESLFHSNPFGFHKPWDACTIEQLQCLFDVDDSSQEITRIKDIRITRKEDGIVIPLKIATKKRLFQWFSLAIGPKGLHIPANAQFPISRISFDIIVYIAFENETEQEILFVYHPSTHMLTPTQYLPKIIETPSINSISLQESPTTILSQIEELGFVSIQQGKIVEQIPPKKNIYTSERWQPTIRYLEKYIEYHPEFQGEYFVCIYDGWREYSEYVDPNARKYIPWSTELVNSFIGKGSEGEPRFMHNHKDISIYPILPRQIIAYTRHKQDKNVLLIPDAEFLRTQFQNFIQPVKQKDISWETKKEKIVWRGSPHISRGYGYLNHGFGTIHPRSLLIKYKDLMLPTSIEVGNYLDVAFDKKEIAWFLQHKYLLDIDGMVSAWSGLYWKLYSKSVVLKLESHWEQWYYHRLKPYIHYIPVSSLHTLPYVMQWCKYNQETCQKIAEESHHFIHEHTYEYSYKGYQIH